MSPGVMHCGAILGRKGGTGGDGWIQARVTMHMVTVVGFSAFVTLAHGFLRIVL